MNVLYYLSSVAAFLTFVYITAHTHWDSNSQEWFFLSGHVNSNVFYSLLPRLLIVIHLGSECSLKNILMSIAVLGVLARLPRSGYLVIFSKLLSSSPDHYDYLLQHFPSVFCFLKLSDHAIWVTCLTIRGSSFLF